MLSEVLQRAQREIADVVGQIRSAQEFVGYMPVIDSIYSPRYLEVISFREYLVPMDPIQRQNDDGSYDYSGPPRLKDAITHVKAAVASINERVFYLGLIREEARVAKLVVAQKLQEGEAAKAELAKLKRKLKR